MSYYTPNILFYGRFDYDPTSGKTAKYVLTQQAGYYPVMEKLAGRNGKVCLYLLPSRDSGSKKDNAPAMRLQAKDSYNLTGLKDLFEGGKLSGVAYGYPSPAVTYSAKQKPNPFFEHKEDGFLFVVHHDGSAEVEADKVRLSSIELIVLEGAKVLIASYCKQLKMGGFDDALKALREQAQNVLTL